MKKICFIGTSHLKAVANAWLNSFSSKYPSIQADFLAAPTAELWQAEFLPEEIRVPSGSKLEEFALHFSNYKLKFTLQDYDCFIFQSLIMPHQMVLELSRQLGDPQKESSQFFSDSCLRTTFDLYLQQTHDKVYLEHIRQYSDAPIVVSLAPKPSILALNKHPNQYKNYLQHADRFNRLFLESCESFLSGYSKIILVKQPETTLATPHFTQLEYCRNYGQVPVETITDFAHQNARYGLVVLKQIFDNLPV